MRGSECDPAGRLNSKRSSKFPPESSFVYEDLCVKIIATMWLLPGQASHLMWMLQGQTPYLILRKVTSWNFLELKTAFRTTVTAVLMLHCSPRPSDNKGERRIKFCLNSIDSKS